MASFWAFSSRATRSISSWTFLEFSHLFRFSWSFAAWFSSSRGSFAMFSTPCFRVGLTRQTLPEFPQPVNPVTGDSHGWGKEVRTGADKFRELHLVELLDELADEVRGRHGDGRPDLDCLGPDDVPRVAGHLVQVQGYGALAGVARDRLDPQCADPPGNVGRRLGPVHQRS